MSNISSANQMTKTYSHTQRLSCRDSTCGKNRKCTMTHGLRWPLLPYAADYKTIYYVPSSILHQIALESIPMGDGTLLGEHYKFVRLTSAREIERYRNDLDIGRYPECSTEET